MGKILCHGHRMMGTRYQVYSPPAIPFLVCWGEPAVPSEAATTSDLWESTNLPSPEVDNDWNPVGLAEAKVINSL